ncbi:MAG: hypothetical protein H7Z15_04705 [Rhizobacter sp.]|nr:hypothetical protein [Rhizobacter sp.]
MNSSRSFYCKALALVAVFAASTASAQTSVGVSVSVNQPGVYGRIDIGNMPPPPVIYAQPIIYAPPRVRVVQEPMYLYVPPGHQKNWGKHCKRYNACGQPVYFVRESWVRERYEHEHGGKGHGKDKHDKHDKKGKGGKHGND